VDRHRRLVLRASRGDCWIAVRLGSAGGSLLYENLLRPGQAVSFERMPLWVRVGAPANLVLIVDGRRLTPLSGYGPVNVVVGPSGIRAV
jgi:RodZ C-terminal domain